MIANTNAIRDNFNIKGVYEYTQLEDIEQLVLQDLEIPDDVERPDERELLKAIRG